MKLLMPVLIWIEVLLIGCTGGGGPEYELGTRSAELSSAPTTTVIGRGTFGSFHVKRKSEDDPRWEIDLNAKTDTDIVVQKVTFPPGSTSGWHTHPGPVFITVTKGTVTFYEANDPACTPNALSAGATLIDAAEANHGHIARNEGTDDAETAVTIFLRKGDPTRVGLPTPGNCPF
jgi:quercetin dioxygenase-like cupin family protein